MLIQSSHSYLDRGLDPYFTPPAATFSLLAIEKLPHRIWEPAAGNGAISSILALTHQVYPSDIADYGNPEIHTGIDYLNTDLSFPPDDLVGIVTNPPFKLALQFIQKSLTEVKKEIEKVEKSRNDEFSIKIDHLHKSYKKLCNT